MPPDFESARSMTPSEPAAAPFSWDQFAVLRFVTIVSVVDWLAAIVMLPSNIKSCVGFIRILFIEIHDNSRRGPPYCTNATCGLHPNQESTTGVSFCNQETYLWF